MNLNNVITGSPVTSGELRAVRDRRVLKKWELLTPGGEICLVEFSLNIAGAVKTFPFARAAFREEVRELSDRLSRFSVLKTEIYENNTGDCAFFLLKSQPYRSKNFSFPSRKAILWAVSSTLTSAVPMEFRKAA